LQVHAAALGKGIVVFIDELVVVIVLALLLSQGGHSVVVIFQVRLKYRWLLGSQLAVGQYNAIAILGSRSGCSPLVRASSLANDLISLMVETGLITSLLSSRWLWGTCNPIEQNSPNWCFGTQNNNNSNNGNAFERPRRLRCTGIARPHSLLWIAVLIVRGGIMGGVGSKHGALGNKDPPRHT